MKPSNENKLQSQRRLIPLSKWPNFHEYPSVGGIRYLMANKDTNGFDKVIRRVGKLILIDENLFFKWVDEQQGECSK